MALFFEKRVEGPFKNILKSPEYVTNSRGQILHVRSWLDIQDDKSKPSALVFFLHGYKIIIPIITCTVYSKCFEIFIHRYASHISRPVHEKIARDLNTHNIGYITLDFHGHGHSDGLRALVTSYVDLVDDIVSLLLAVYSTSTVNPEQNYRVAQTFDTDVPFFIMGHSMGGAITLLTANFLTRSTLSTLPSEDIRFTSIEKQWKGKNKSFDIILCINVCMYVGICSAFKGCLLYSPAVEVSSPSIFIRGLLTYVLVPLIPTVEIPPSFSSMSDNTLIWEDPIYIDYVVADAHPAGLSWGGSLRIQTAWALLNAADEVKASIANMTYPFIVFHDPEDAICRIKGSEMLLTGSTLLPESDKKLVTVDGGRHDLITNRLQDMITQSVEWIHIRLSLCNPSRLIT